MTLAAACSRLATVQGYWEQYEMQNQEILRYTDYESRQALDYLNKDLFSVTVGYYDVAFDYYHDYFAILARLPLVSALQKQQSVLVEERAPF